MRLRGRLAAAGLVLTGLSACNPEAGLDVLSIEQTAEAEAPAEAETASDALADRVALERETASVHRDLAAGLEAAGEPEGALVELELALKADARARAAGRAAKLAARTEGKRRETEDNDAGEDFSSRSYDELERICKRNDPPAQAQRACTLIIASFPSSAGRLPELLTARGDAFFALEKFDNAADDYSAAIKIDSAYAQALLGRARVRVGQDLPAAAARDYRRAINAGLAAPEIRTERAGALMDAGRPGLAVGEYDRILSDPDQSAAHPAAYRGRAQAHCADGQADAASVDWQVWLAGAPEEGAAALAVDLAETGFLPEETLDGPFEVSDETLAALNAWTAAGCPVRAPRAPDQTAQPGTKPYLIPEAPAANELTEG
ncbi:MAG: tetratricopeptide repeat protein [Paracoccaceae bacterium]|nr:tetratricopeptide repeat protein [Paracoccaceae bacterium]